MTLGVDWSKQNLAWRRKGAHFPRQLTLAGERRQIEQMRGLRALRGMFG
jgi:hypothetical protein